MRSRRLGRWRHLRSEWVAPPLSRTRIDAPVAVGAELRAILRDGWRGLDLRLAAHSLLLGAVAALVLVALIGLLQLLPGSARPYAPVELVWLEDTTAPPRMRPPVELPEPARESVPVPARVETVDSRSAVEDRSVPLLMDPVPAPPRSAAARASRFRAPKLPAVSARPEASLLAMDGLAPARSESASSAPSDVRAATAASTLDGSDRVRPALAPPAARIPTPAPAPEPALPLPEASAPTPSGHPGRLSGVPLASLAACESNTREDRLKQKILVSVRDRPSCSSHAGTYHFVQTNNLNAFLMWIEKSSARKSRNRCGELDLALACLSARETEELGS